MAGAAAERGSEPWPAPIVFLPEIDFYAEMLYEAGTTWSIMEGADATVDRRSLVQLVAPFTVVIGGCAACSSTVQPRRDQAVALAFVEETDAGGDLAELAQTVGARTETYRIVASRFGAERTRQMLGREVAARAPRFQKQWNRNLAAIYADRFSSDELVSLARDRARSPYASKLFREREAIGERMAAQSTGLLKEMLTEVLRELLRQTAEADGRRTDGRPYGGSIRPA